MAARRRREHRYYVYIMSSQTRVLYVGVTNDLERRVAEHRSASVEQFTGRYRAHQLVYYEETSDVRAAIERERQLKGWTRRRKLDLIQSANPGWRDLSSD